jgi:hypothetical protein
MDWIQLLTAAQTFMVEELSASPRTLTPRRGARAPSRAGDDALVIADFLFLAEYDPDPFAGSRNQHARARALPRCEFSRDGSYLNDTVQ